MRDNWTFYRTDELDKEEFLDEYLEQLIAITDEGFGIDMKMNRAKFRSFMEDNNVTGILQNEAGKLGGFIFCHVPDGAFNGYDTILFSKMSMARNFQGRGNMKFLHFADHIAELMPERRFGWMTGKTQNTIILRHFNKYANFMYPFDRLYEPSTYEYLVKQIDEFKICHEQGIVNELSGICTGVYREHGRLGDYPEIIPGMEKIASFLHYYRFSRERGDSLIMLAAIADNTEPVSTQEESRLPKSLLMAI